MLFEYLHEKYHEEESFGSGFIKRFSLHWAHLCDRLFDDMMTYNMKS